MSYIGETGLTFGTRLDYHKKEVGMITTRRFTRGKKKMFHKHRTNIVGNNTP